jgi:hypothetical protein
MTEMSVTEQRPGRFVVELTGASRATTHNVDVPAGLAVRLGGAGTSDERLVKESFRYLLEREPNTSILRDFSIDRIGDYFPGWADEIRQRLSE